MADLAHFYGRILESTHTSFKKKLIKVVHTLGGDKFGMAIRAPCAELIKMMIF